MADRERGNPDELVAVLRNWLRQAESLCGTLPDGTDRTEWAIRQFINYWKDPLSIALDGIEASLQRAMSLCRTGAASHEITNELENAREILQCDLRDDLGLTQWHRESE